MNSKLWQKQRRNIYGYYICVETTDDGSAIDFSDEFISGYYARNRPWYQKGLTASKPVFIDIYNDTDHIPAISCVTSYYDGNGDFAGVISIAYRIINFLSIFIISVVLLVLFLALMFISSSRMSKILLNRFSNYQTACNLR